MAFRNCNSFHIYMRYLKLVIKKLVILVWFLIRTVCTNGCGQRNLYMYANVYSLFQKYNNLQVKSFLVLTFLYRPNTVVVR